MFRIWDGSCDWFEAETDEDISDYSRIEEKLFTKAELKLFF